MIIRKKKSKFIYLTDFRFKSSHFCYCFLLSLIIYRYSLINHFFSCVKIEIFYRFKMSCNQIRQMTRFSSFLFRHLYLISLDTVDYYPFNISDDNLRRNSLRLSHQSNLKRTSADTICHHSRRRVCWSATVIHRRITSSTFREQ